MKKQVDPRTMKTIIRKMIIAIAESGKTEKKVLMAKVSLETCYSKSFISEILENMILINEVTEEDDFIFIQKK